MSVRRTAALAVTLLVLSLYFFTFERDPVEPSEPDWTRAPKIVDCGGGGARALRVTTPKGERLEARRETGRWRIEPAPTARRQAENALDDLAEALCTLPIIETIADPDSLAAFGLDEPLAEVRLETGSGESVIRVGALTPARNFLYLGKEGSASVLKVGALVRSEVDKVLQHAGAVPESAGEAVPPDPESEPTDLSRATGARIARRA